MMTRTTKPHRDQGVYLRDRWLARSEGLELPTF
jgi:hypothetical protein